MLGAVLSKFTFFRLVIGSRGIETLPGPVPEGPVPPVAGWGDLPRAWAMIWAIVSWSELDKFAEASVSWEAGVKALREPKVKVC